MPLRFLKILSKTKLILAFDANFASLPNLRSFKDFKSTVGRPKSLLLTFRLLNIPICIAWLHLYYYYSLEPFRNHTQQRRMAAVRRTTENTKSY